jgi:hypothetical protein
VSETADCDRVLADSTTEKTHIDELHYMARHLDKIAHRARTSGFIYRSGFARSVPDRLVVALAVADGTIEDMVLSLKAERSELDRT